MDPGDQAAPRADDVEVDVLRRRPPVSPATTSPLIDIALNLGGTVGTLPPAVTPRQVLSRSTEWVLRRQALREARAAVLPRGERRDRAVCQARLLLEVARRVAEPVERLPARRAPAGARRRCIGRRLTGRWSPASPAGGDAAAGPRRRVGGRGSRAACAAPPMTTSTLEAVKRLLVDRSPPDPLDVPDEDAARARGFAADAAGRSRRAASGSVERTLFQRWWRVSLVALRAGDCGAGRSQAVARSEPARRQADARQLVLGGLLPGRRLPGGAVSHRAEANPWVEFDLGARKTFSGSR